MNKGKQELNIWTTVYSDMVTNLMLFFLMLYGLSRMSADARTDIAKGLEKKFRGATAAELRVDKALKKFTDEEATARATSVAGTDTSVNITEKQIKITLNAPVLFQSGKAALSSAAKDILNEVANIIKPMSNKIIIEGYTDNIPISGGIYPTNWELSIARAYSVVEYYVKEKRIPPERFIAAGYGEQKSIASNDTEEGRKKNRRIEIVIVR